MKANILNYGKFQFMRGLAFPITVECQLSARKTCIEVTPAQLIAAGVEYVPDEFCSKVWYFLLGKEAVIIEENNDE